MRRIAFIVLLVAGLAPATSASRTAPPALRVVDRSPLTVLGTGFKPRERVVVRALGATTPLRVRTVASRVGRFRVVLQMTLDPCTGPAVIRAAGIKGSLVLLKLSLRECPSPVEPLDVESLIPV